MTDNTGNTPHDTSGDPYVASGAGAYPPYGQQPYGSQPYGQQGYGPSASGEHPQAQAVFWLGIVGIFTVIGAWIAWYLGGKAKKEIQNGAPYRYEGNLKTGHLLGKILGIIYLVGAVISIVVAIIAFIALASINPS